MKPPYKNDIFMTKNDKARMKVITSHPTVNCVVGSPQWEPKAEWRYKNVSRGGHWPPV